MESDLNAKVRKETETRIQSPTDLVRILEGLGFVTIYQYQKYRTVFRLGQATLDLDETPIGCFVEVEGSPDAIESSMSAMGMKDSTRIVENYRTLHMNWLEERELPKGPMLFDVES